jgi:hypothetical protein
MMIRKSIASLAAVAAVFLAFATSAHAESGWHLLNMTEGVSDLSRKIYDLLGLRGHRCGRLRSDDLFDRDLP